MSIEHSEIVRVAARGQQQVRHATRRLPQRRGLAGFTARNGCATERLAPELELARTPVEPAVSTRVPCLV